MTTIIVLFQSRKMPGMYAGLLVRHGFSVSALLQRGLRHWLKAELLWATGSGLRYKYPDYDLFGAALGPAFSYFEMILVASQRVLSECGDPD